ncbi:MAG: hypothetical protein ACO2OX_04705 [Candidatus Nanopusillus sp.]
MKLYLNSDLSFSLFDKILLNKEGFCKKIDTTNEVIEKFPITDVRLIIENQKTSSLINNTLNFQYGILLFDKNGYLVKYAEKFIDNKGSIKIAEDKYYLDKYFFLPVYLPESKPNLWELIKVSDDEYAFLIDKNLLLFKVSEDIIYYLKENYLNPLYSYKNDKIKRYSLIKINEDIVEESVGNKSIIHAKETTKEHEIELTLNLHPQDPSKYVLEYRTYKKGKLSKVKQYEISDPEQIHNYIKRILSLPSKHSKELAEILISSINQPVKLIREIKTHNIYIKVSSLNFENKLIEIKNDKYGVFIDKNTFKEISEITIPKVKINLSNLKLLSDLNSIKYAIYKDKNHMLIYDKNKLYDIYYQPTKEFIKNQQNTKLSIGYYDNKFFFVDINQNKKYVIDDTDIEESVIENAKQILKKYNIAFDNEKVSQLLDEVREKRVLKIKENNPYISNNKYIYYKDNKLYEINLDPLTYSILTVYGFDKYPKILDDFKSAELIIKVNDNIYRYIKEGEDIQIKKEINNGKLSDNINIEISIKGYGVYKDNMPISDLLDIDKENGQFYIDKKFSSYIRLINDNIISNTDFDNLNIIHLKNISSYYDNKVSSFIDPIDTLNNIPFTYFNENTENPFSFFKYSENIEPSKFLLNSKINNEIELNKNKDFIIKFEESDHFEVKPIYYDYNSGSYKYGEDLILSNYALNRKYGNIEQGLIVKYNPNYIKDIHYGPLIGNGIEFINDVVKIVQDDKVLFIKTNKNINSHLSIEIDNNMKKLEKVGEYKISFTDFDILERNNEYKVVFKYHNFPILKYDLNEKHADDVEPLFDNYELSVLSQQIEQIQEIDPEFAEIITNVLNIIENGESIIKLYFILKEIRKSIATLIVFNEFQDTGISNERLQNLLRYLTDFSDLVIKNFNEIIENYLTQQQQLQQQEEEEEESKSQKKKKK